LGGTNSLDVEVLCEGICKDISAMAKKLFEGLRNDVIPGCNSFLTLRLLSSSLMTWPNKQEHGQI
jgi:hypothetical protein